LTVALNEQLDQSSLVDISGIGDLDRVTVNRQLRTPDRPVRQPTVDQPHDTVEQRRTQSDNQSPDGHGVKRLRVLWDIVAAHQLDRRDIEFEQPTPQIARELGQLDRVTTRAAIDHHTESQGAAVHRRTVSVHAAPVSNDTEAPDGSTRAGRDGMPGCITSNWPWPVQYLAVARP
jgi:hypothetical protein